MTNAQAACSPPSTRSAQGIWRCASTDSPSVIAEPRSLHRRIRSHKSLVFVIGDDENSTKTRLPNYDILTNTKGTIGIASHVCPRSSLGLRSLPFVRSPACRESILELISAPKSEHRTPIPQPRAAE